MTAKITVGIPFFNNETTLELAIISVVGQTFEDWLLYLVDDGSCDQSLAIAQKYVHLDKRIHLISDGLNKGLIFRLNQIINISDTIYIARMDADDIMLPDRLKMQFDVMEFNKNIDIVSSGVYSIDNLNNPVGVRGVHQLDNISAKSVLKNSPIIHPTILVRTLWYKSNLYDSKYYRAEDFELWCRTFADTVFFNISEPLLLYREGNVSITNYLASMKTLRKIIRQYSNGRLSILEMIMEILRSHAKSFIYSLFGLFNLQYVLTKKRNSALTEIQKESIVSFIRDLNENVQR